MISKEQLSELPDVSVTLYVIVVVPIGNKEPLTGPEIRIVDGPLQLSVPTGAI